MRRLTAPVSMVLLVVLAAAIAEAALLALMVVFIPILQLHLGIEFGNRVVQVYENAAFGFPTITVHNAGTWASFLFTLACGLGAATWRYRRWSAR